MSRLPCAQVRDAGNLLTRAGLSIPAVDVDEVTVRYEDAAQLVTHLRWASGTAWASLSSSAGLAHKCDGRHLATHALCHPPLPLPCRLMGESNALVKRRSELPRDVALATAAAYAGLFGEEGGGVPGGCQASRLVDACLRRGLHPRCRTLDHARAPPNPPRCLPAATYEVIFMTGWAPHPRQQQPAPRGSATVSFEDLVQDLGGGSGGAGGQGGSTSADSCSSSDQITKP